MDWIDENVLGGRHGCSRNLVRDDGVSDVIGEIWASTMRIAREGPAYFVFVNCCCHARGLG